MKNERRIIGDAEVQRLIGLAQGLASGSVNMTEGELLGERIGIGRVQLPPEQIEFVYAQTCKVCESRNYAAGRFATEVLVPLIGTQPLTSEQVGHLLHLLHNFTGIDTAEAASGLCQHNASEMERLVGTLSSRVPDVIGVYRTTRSPVLLERLIAEASKTLSGSRYQSEHYQPETERILATIVENPPDHPTLREVILSLLQSSKPGGPLRNQIEAVVAKTLDITLLLPLLLAFEADLDAYRDRWQKSSWMQDHIKGMKESQELVLTSFNSAESAAVRGLFGILRDCQAIPHRSDHARLELRRKAVSPAATILARAPGVLSDFADVFAVDDDSQTDLVYIVCCLPQPGAVAFLKSELKREDLSPRQHAAFAVALSYAMQDALPEVANVPPLVAPADGSSARTWWGDEAIERTCHEACARSAVYLGRVFESSPKSHEERLTGMLLAKLQIELQHWAKDVETWAAKKFGRYSSVHCSYEDVAANGPEKVWGADIGFYLRVRADGVLTAERAFLAQAKKAGVSAHGKELAWTIDRVQRDILIGQSSWSVYFLYGCYKTGNGVRVVPASAVRDVMAGANTKTRISAARAVTIARPFADFFTYDFLADWWGDCDGRALDIVRGRVEDFPVRVLFSIDVNLGAAG